jgi:hypothetical protein
MRLHPKEVEIIERLRNAPADGLLKLLVVKQGNRPRQVVVQKETAQGLDELEGKSVESPQ